MLKNDEVDYCTKCTVKPIVKEHMCEECYESHNEWLRELSAPKQDSDQWYTLYESEQPSLRKILHKTVLEGLDKRLEKSINESGARE